MNAWRPRQTTDAGATDAAADQPPPADQPQRTPKPARQALEYLSDKCVTGAEISTIDLAIALQTDLSTLRKALKVPLLDGRIFSRIVSGAGSGARGRGVRFWSLMDHSKKSNGAAQAPRSESVREVDLPLRTPEAAPPNAARAPIMSRAECVAAEGPRLTPDAYIDRIVNATAAVKSKVQREPRHVQGQLRIALWSDGTLEIRGGDIDVVLQLEQTRQLVDYLDSISLEHLREEGGAC